MALQTALLLTIDKVYPMRNLGIPSRWYLSRHCEVYILHSVDYLAASSRPHAMPTQTRIQIAKPDIVSLFRDNPRRVYAHRDIEQILSENRSFWRLAQSTTVNDFIAFMIDRTDLQAVRLDFPNRPVNRYTWGEVAASI